jgi:hypothetical protein
MPSAFITCSPSQTKEFWAVYEKLFSLVLNKWSTKGKHTLFCYDLLWKMVCLFACNLSSARC